MRASKANGKKSLRDYGYGAFPLRRHFPELLHDLRGECESDSFLARLSGGWSCHAGIVQYESLKCPLNISYRYHSGNADQAKDRSALGPEGRGATAELGS
jgi:hypothetical protein